LGAVRELVIAAATVAVAVCTALIYPLKHLAPVDSLGVVYVVAVLLVSATWGLPLGVITALGSVLAFDRGIGAAAAALAARSPLPVEVAAGEERYAPHVEAAAYFFIAEALTNVAKHAQATYAELSVQPRDDRLIVDVRDDGDGGADSTGSGIRGRRDRIEALGGKMQITSPPGHGTHLQAAIPHSGSLDRDR
jgi:signal transduction histidine kinase